MSTPPKVFTKIEELKRWRHLARGRVGVVPTMGALHAGHVALLREMKESCDHPVLTIFVNPTQFGPQEDLSRYPRTLESDLALAEREGVEVVFAPSPEEIYPQGYSTYVEETQVSLPLCGPQRPGHFRGVTTVVLKLFNLVQPHLAWFGLKDAQQFYVIQKMAEDLHLTVEIRGIPTVREEDGLAMSSRNVYLSPEDRKRAPLIRQTLLEVGESLETGASVAGTLQLSRELLTRHGFSVQYLEVVTLPDLVPVDFPKLPRSGSYLVAAAAMLGGTRLIDNLKIEFPDH